MANELRQGKNALTIVGAIKEHKLSKFEGKDKDGKSQTSINGSFVVKAGEFKEVEVNVFVAEKTSKGKDNKTYKVLESILNETNKTMANVTEDEVVTKVRIQGSGDFTPQFKEDMYKKKDVDEVATLLKIDLGFGNVTIDNSINEDKYKAEFDLEIYVTNIIEELDKEENETGRVKVKGWLPVYGGKVIPIEMVAGTTIGDDGEEINIAEGIQDAIEEGSTFNAWGDINFEKIIEETKKGGSIGKAKVETKNTYINELVITGGDVVSEEKEFDGELVKQAKLERDKAIEEKKNEAPKEEKKTKGIGKGGDKDKKRTRPTF
jgi:hypothetical protein